MSNFNFDKLISSENRLKWLANKPYEVILETVTQLLNQHVRGAILQSFVVTSDPDWLTGFLPVENNSENKILTRSGCAFECDMYVQTSDQLHHLTAVYSWVAVNMDDSSKTRQKTWLDIDKDLSTIGINGELKERIYLE